MFPFGPSFSLVMSQMSRNSVRSLTTTWKWTRWITWWITWPSLPLRQWLMLHQILLHPTWKFYSMLIALTTVFSSAHLCPGWVGCWAVAVYDSLVLKQSLLDLTWFFFLQLKEQPLCSWTHQSTELPTLHHYFRCSWSLTLCHGTTVSPMQWEIDFCQTFVNVVNFVWDNVLLLKLKLGFYSTQEIKWQNCIVSVLSFFCSKTKMYESSPSLIHFFIDHRYIVKKKVKCPLCLL